MVNPLANNPGAPIGLGMALNGQTTSTTAPATIVQTSGQVLGTAIPTVIRNGVTIGQIGTALAALPTKASLTAIAAAIGTAGAPNAAEAPVTIPAGTTVAQIVAAIATLPVGATSVQIASAIGGIIPAPAVNNTTTQTPTTAQPPSMLNCLACVPSCAICRRKACRLQKPCCTFLG